MADRIEVSVEGVEEAQEVLRRLPKRAERIIARALNRTATHLRSEASKRIRSEINITAAKIRTRLQIRRAKRGQLRAQVLARKRGLQLINFGARGVTVPAAGGARRKAGVSVKVKRGGSREKLRSAFIVTLPNNVRAVVERAPGAKRLPIDVLYGPSVSQAYAVLLPEVNADGQKFLQRSLRSQIDFELSR